MPIISISEYKMELLKDVYKDKKIVSALDSQQLDYVPDEPDSLIYLNLFPYLRIPETQNKADTYVLISVDIDKISRSNQTYAMYTTTFWILTHKERMKLAGFNATRIDYISEEVKKLFDGVQKFGFSEFELISNREIILNEKYTYRELTFTCYDLRHAVTALGRDNSG